MVTLFSSPKPFRGHIAVIQENAFRSWAKLGLDVIVFDDTEGTAEMCRKLGFRHRPEVQRNEYGTPLISAIWRDAERLARHDVTCYVNADILLLPDFVTACKVLETRKAMMIGRRTNLDQTELIDFERPDWEAALRKEVAQRGELHQQGGVDYFAHRRGVLGPLPPMALGRGFWDMWLIYRARARGAEVIDATASVLAIHQNHDYQHLGPNWVEENPEAKRNQELAGWPDKVWHPSDATHDLGPNGVSRRSVPLRRRLRKLAVLHPQLAWPVKAALGMVRRLRG